MTDVAPDRSDSDDETEPFRRSLTSVRTRTLLEQLSAMTISGVFGGVGVGWLVTLTGWSATFLVGGGLAFLAGFGVIVLRPPVTTERSLAK